MFVEVLFGNRFERLEFIDSRVVDENIELAERLLRFGKELLQLRMFCDVRLHGESPAAVFGDLGNGGVGALFAG